MTANLGPWAARLVPASWRGLTFQVSEATVVRGRKTALHEYPDRDTVWVEDLGRGTRRYAFRGFLIGDDVYDQRDRMMAAFELPGTGTLVHPSIGTRTVSLTGNASMGERAELGRVVELVMEFIENAGTVLFPTSAASTQDQTNTAADNAKSAVTSDFTGQLAAAGANV
jgi:prophage DNA circulation protein